MKEKNDLLDDKDYEPELYSGSIQHIGIGVFLWLSLMGFSILLVSICKEFLIIYNVKPILNIWITEIIACLFILFGFLLAIRKVKGLGLKKVKLFFRNMILLFILSQILQFVHLGFILDILPDTYYLNLKSYYSYFNQTSYVSLISVGFDILIYIIIGIVIIKMSKSNRSNSAE